MYQEMAQKSKIFVKQKLCIEREKNVFLMQIGGKSGKCIRRWQQQKCIMRRIKKILIDWR